MPAANAADAIIEAKGLTQIKDTGALEGDEEGCACRASGSPGTADPEPARGVVINEIGAHTDTGQPPPYDSDDWIELYNAARRAGKDFVLLVYGGENHGNRKKANQIDYHNRIVEWFGHYLKGDPAPEWMTAGMPYVQQKDEIMGGGN